MRNKKFYITDEAAKFLGISRSSLKNLRRMGKLVPDKYGRNNSVFYSEEQLKKYLASKKTVAVVVWAVLGLYAVVGWVLNKKGVEE